MCLLYLKVLTAAVFDDSSAEITRKQSGSINVKMKNKMRFFAESMHTKNSLINISGNEYIILQI